MAPARTENSFSFICNHILWVAIGCQADFVEELDPKCIHLYKKGHHNFFILFHFEKATAPKGALHSLKFSHNPLRVPSSPKYPKYQTAVFKFVIIQWKQQLSLQQHTEHFTHDDLFPACAFYQRCLESLRVFVQPCFDVGCRKTSGLTETEQRNATKGRPRQPKTCCKYTFPARHFWTVGTLRCFIMN